MDSLYIKIQRRAHKIAAKYPRPEFYSDFSGQIALSKEFFNTDPVIARLYRLVANTVDNDLGHGLEHATKVTIDAGALFLINAKQYNFQNPEQNRGLQLVQCAGLLHDIRRKEKNHAQAGAKAARIILEDYPFSPEENKLICLAIRNHEAFRTPEPARSRAGAITSDCLYDADKFRWGPDNFTDTVWHMISFFKAPVSVFLDRYPEGIKGIKKIRATFRTKTGKVYGPKFIDTGLLIGEEIRQMLKKEFLTS